MFKKIILCVATLAIVAVAYQIYSWQDDTAPRARQAPSEPLPPRVSQRASAASQPSEADDFGERGFAIGDARIPSGEAPVFRMYDRRGNAKIIFRATEWEPISDDEVHMVRPRARLLLPGGQLAYVRADEGQVTVRKEDNDNLNAKKGWFRGNVSIFIDLTKPAWRKEHPHLFAPEQHPQAVVKIWMDEARFDLELTRLESAGPIRLESARGTIEGRGLTLIWDEADRRVKFLTIAEGKRATLRNVQLADLGLPGQVVEPAGASRLPEAQPPAAVLAAARGEKEMAGSAKAPDGEGLGFLEPDGTGDEPSEDRVDTYRIVFADNVVAEQKEAVKVAGRLTANVLELLCDLGREDREALEQSPATRPSGAEPAGASTPAPAAKVASARARSTVELQWTGRLEITPVEETSEAKPTQENRIHLLAKGSPVRIEDPGAGHATCLELEYHTETEQIWLRGSPDQWVTLQSDPHQQLMGEQIHVDQKTRIARMTGAGRLIGRASDWTGEALPGLDLPQADAGSPAPAETVEITWGPSAEGPSVEIEFGTSDADSTTALAGASVIPEGTYLKHAVFNGRVTLTEPDRSIAADRAEITFKKPLPGSASPDDSDDRSRLIADRVVASGHVRMTQTNDQVAEHVSCDRLEVQLTLDDTGKSVPSVARAMGHVEARQMPRAGGPPAKMAQALTRKIQADDELVIELSSVPDPVTDTEIDRYKAKAREKNIEPGSARWVAFEQRLRNRRKIITTGMTAVGNVVVQDPEQELDLGADRLECTFGRSEEIHQALIVGREDKPAYVDLGDFFIRGPRISLDMATEIAEVPGGGRLKFFTKQDLDGRPVEDPIPVVITWQGHMQLEGQKNAGRFTGAAHAVGESIALDCRELQLQFEDLPTSPAAPASPTGPDSRWVAGPVIDSLRPHDRESATGRATRRIRKRLALVDAMGDAVIQSAVYAGPPERGSSPAERLYDTLTPAWLAASADQSSAGSLRLTSRVRLAGPWIEIDLVRERLSVKGPGNLSVEDYRQPPARPRTSAATPGSSLLDGSSLASLESIGPSQTAFAWDNSMLFVNDHNLAVFDRAVGMRHLAGSKMLDLPRLAAATHLDLKELEQREGRQATLTCDNLVVEFERDATRSESDPSPLSRATRLKSFKALGLVRLQEGNRAVSGAQVAYRSDSGIGRVLGSRERELPAKLFVMDERTGRTAISSVDLFEWNQKTGLIRAHGSRVLATTK